MNNKKIRKRIITSIIGLSIFNIIALAGWFLFRISPLLNETKYLNEYIFKDELKDEYNSYNELEKDTLNITKKYKLKCIIEDYQGNIINNISKDGISLGSDLIRVDNDYYIIKLYTQKSSYYGSIALELILFQSILILITFILLYGYYHKIILNPISNILEKIKNYKLGKRLKESKLNGEFYLIAEELENLADDIEKEKANQNRIIASISHDLKTPLTSIIGYSNLINDNDTTKEEIIEYNSKIYSKAVDMKEILSNFDDYLINQEKITIKYNKISLNDLIKDLKDSYELELQNKGITFNIDTNISNQIIEIDIIKIKRVFSNIISNSVRYLNKNDKIIININLIRHINI